MHNIKYVSNKTSKGSLELQTPLKIKGNLIGSKANHQSQAEPT